ncbi:MAG: lytic transglycosylase domain-containing protein [Ruminococcus sp.]|uniref:Soluble lytic murein transglycosylase n=1 Tax=Ruminococcus albus TaxID=1264 RepID=A0A1H7FLC8_RUMAL|nr:MULTISPECIES: lytic transglycosylase domain-containing protein [Ruminococcus]MBO4867710.1 lytic transglycosylase domain-containing protein [Ruminococcus sp.]SEK26791.1 soluble lytic murein transglycosylase [Ruminococcus albus]
MATKTNRRASAPKRKRKKKNSAGDWIVVILGIVFALGIVLLTVFLLKRSISKGLEDVTEKAKDYVPHGFTYPTDYEEYVLKYCKEYQVDPVLVFSVIKVESNFDHQATSEVGARGLMQLMEDAYDWVKFRLDDDSESYDDMYDPETNIKYGTYYLSFLMERYDDSIDLAAAAYHCGMGQVDSWLEDGTLKAEKFDVNDIPKENDQTSHYVNKINDAYSAYKKILSERGIDSIFEDESAEELESEVSESFDETY